MTPPLTTVSNDYFVVSTLLFTSLNRFRNKLDTVLMSLAELFDRAWFETSHRIALLPQYTQYTVVDRVTAHVVVWAPKGITRA